jgi:hypothetical protein
LPVNGGHYDGVASFELPYGKHRVEFEFLWIPSVGCASHFHKKSCSMFWLARSET